MALERTERPTGHKDILDAALVLVATDGDDTVTTDLVDLELFHP